jgi:hypothetical protein
MRKQALAKSRRSNLSQEIISLLQHALDLAATQPAKQAKPEIPKFHPRRVYARGSSTTVFLKKSQAFYLFCS